MNNQLKKKKKFSWTYILYVLGVSIILYPILSNQYYKWVQRSIITQYTEQINQMDDAQLLQQKKDRLKYNEDLSDTFGQSLNMPSFETSLLPKIGATQLPMSEMLGVVYIPKISVKLPIYYGTGEAQLQVGTGVIEGTSLPMGGAGTHSVITGHRGLPTARLFTDLPKLQIKDKFYIDTLKEKLAYEVDHIEVIEPTDIDALKIVPGEDYVTLLTCTPYMINTHRLLVRGKRIPFSNAEWNKQKQIARFNLIKKIMFILCLLLLLLLIYLYLRHRKKKKQELYRQQLMQQQIKKQQSRKNNHRNPRSVKHKRRTE